MELKRGGSKKLSSGPRPRSSGSTPRAGDASPQSVRAVANGEVGGETDEDQFVNFFKFLYGACHDERGELRDLDFHLAFSTRFSEQNDQCHHSVVTMRFAWDSETLVLCVRFAGLKGEQVGGHHSDAVGALKVRCF